MKPISPILVTYVFGFVDMLIRFRVKKSKFKVTVGNDPKTGRIGLQYHCKYLSYFYECSWAWDILIRPQGKRLRSQQAMAQPCEHHISQTNGENFTQFWSQIYLGL